jgi:hypothetical protein
MATLLPSIVEMQRHITSEVELLRRNMHKLEDVVSRLATAEPIHASATAVAPTTVADTSSLGHDELAQCMREIRNLDLKLEQYIAHFQVEHSQQSLLSHDASSRLDEAIRNEQLRNDMTNQKVQDLATRVDEIYATTHGDHIRLDVLNSNLQGMISTIATINQSVESMSTSVNDLTATFGAHRALVNGRLDALEKAP